MTTEINKILSDWDPIRVGSPLSLDEYKIYVSELVRLPIDEEQIKSYVINILGKMGLDYLPNSDLQNQEIDDIVKKILVERRKY